MAQESKNKKFFTTEKLKKLGWIGFLFFLLKGLGWLALSYFVLK